MMVYAHRAGVLIPYSHKNKIVTGFELPEEPKKEKHEKDLSPEAKVLIVKLSDHKWHKKTEFDAQIGVFILNGLSDVPIAQSDSAKYICIPGDKTPILAPDGT